jgi:cellulose synthase (UDP-forming)
MRKFELYATLAVLSGLLYISWLAFHVEGWIGQIYFVLELGMYLLVLIFSYNHASRKYQVLGGGYNLRARVDIFIPTKNERVSMVRETASAAKLIDYAYKRIYILDDSGRQSMQKLASELGVSYVHRKNTHTKNFKAANLNHGLSVSSGNFILVLDADQKPTHKIVDDLLGHFKNPKVALVATKQTFNVDEKDFNNDHLFYNYMQTGKNADDVGISCGSGVIYRRSALEAIGGFQEWNLVEDLYTTYVLNSKGYSTLYISLPYTRGIAPSLLQNIYKQRRNWATDTLRLFFWRQPLFNSHLSFRQKLHFFEMGYIYIVSGMIIPLLFFVNYFSLATNNAFIKNGLVFLILKLISFALALRLFNVLSEGSMSTRMWASLFPINLQAIFQAIRYKKPTYVVTQKREQGKDSFWLVLPQAALLGVGCFLVLWYVIFLGFSPLVVVNTFWIVVLAYWVFPVFKKVQFFTIKEV